MTRRDQILRCWIERDAKGQPWQSVISYQGKIHKKSTHTLLRKAAKDFAKLHLAELFRSQKFQTAESNNTPSQTELFS
jgi:hypothetical protein